MTDAPHAAANDADAAGAPRRRRRLPRVLLAIGVVLVVLVGGSYITTTAIDTA